MPDWRELRVEGLGPIERVVAVFQIGPPLEWLPFPSFKAKVVERVSADSPYVAVLNVALRGPDGHRDGQAGIGDTVEAALEDALRRFAQAVKERGPVTEDDFVWSDPTEF
jgi:hypothetical protein